MQRATKEQIEDVRIQLQTFSPLNRFHFERRECLLPIPSTPIITGKCNALSGVPHMIHQSQSRFGTHALQEMIFDNDALPRDTSRLTQESHRVGGVMEHIHEHHHIHAGRLKRDGSSVECSNRHPRFLSKKHIDTGKGKIFTFLIDGPCKLAAAAAHIQDGYILRENIRQVTGETTNTSFLDIPGVGKFHKVHRRRIPKMLTKKLDKMV